MKFSQLAIILTLLAANFGSVSESGQTHFQEDCAGCGSLTAGVRLFHLVAARRDVFCLQSEWSCYGMYVCSLICFGAITQKTYSWKLTTCNMRVWMQYVVASNLESGKHVRAPLVLLTAQLSVRVCASWATELIYNTMMNLLVPAGFLACLQGVTC